MQDFTEFGPWKKAMELALSIHEMTKSFPKTELYELTSQMRRASLSVAANIAEGFGRYTYPDKMHKYVQARGELVEIISFLYYCYGVKYIDLEQRDNLLKQGQEVHRMLNALITKMAKMSTP
ncbi:MAG: four helix bundle protein [Candidatus Peribacteraceae bacterium]